MDKTTTKKEMPRPFRKQNQKTVLIISSKQKNEKNKKKTTQNPTNAGEKHRISL